MTGVSGLRRFDSLSAWWDTLVNQFVDSSHCVIVEELVAASLFWDLFGEDGICVVSIMSGNAQGTVKRLGTEALLKALMLKMDAMDQGIASLKLEQPRVHAEQFERNRRAGVPPKEAFLLVPKRARGQGRCKKGLQGQATVDPDTLGAQDTSTLVVALVIQMLRELGPAALLVKSDIESAFRLLPVYPQDFHLLGFQFE
ncbi:hypothetical protein NDU88_003984 [Pleurodeles waltl]|uniref:Reverse transcriptase domain-containing protein n=1 Tax=Pleurodeles waltl TaxID=8319 RepID=A0AAV7W742_PLEWA|nr:hypothetical protein NDU88_003984 [Pleurodeles waltl]